MKHTMRTFQDRRGADRMHSSVRAALLSGGLALVILSAGCHSRDAADGGPGANATTGPDTSAGGAAEPAHTQAEASKSILRPDVLPDPVASAAPKIEPVDTIVPFGSSGLKLDDAGRMVVDRALASPVAALDGPIILRGSTDSKGTDAANRKASRKRADRVRDYMIEKGVDKARITVIALGETRPIAPNAHKDGTDDPEGRARNRRVEIEIDVPPPPQDDRGTPQDQNSQPVPSSAETSASDEQAQTRTIRSVKHP